MSQKIDNFALIIGSMKSGTTSLFDYLAQHPEISPCSYKEPHFFSKANRFNKGFKYYQSLWNWNSKQHKVALEASAGYTGVKSVDMQHGEKLNSAASIAKFQTEHNLKFKFIYIMRDPIERLESHLNHVQAWRYHDRKITEDKLNMMIDSSRYAMQLNEYYQRFDPQDFLLLNFEDLKHKPQQLLVKICEFLEINPEYQFSGSGVNQNSHQRKKIIIIPGWYSIRGNKFMRSLVMYLPQELRNIFRSLFGRKIKSQYIRFSVDEKEYIVSQLKQDLYQLKSDYKFDISRWNLENT